MRIPSDRQIRDWHERFAPDASAFELVWTHCRIVCELAEELHTDGNLALIRAGALLHDIGVHRLGAGDHYIRHGLLGEHLLAELGLPAAISRFCSHHTGVGVTAADILDQHLPLPPGDYLAETPEEALVMYADKFHSKTTPPVFVSPETYALKVARFGPGKPALFAALRARYGDPDLAAAAERHGHPVI
ncbi:HD domain-containing protein [Actinoplanes sp. NPDC051861]|uniref:HD domain-containing protein n=1 Tax=Actinoplanes sp. NPDC051861 TaxID=3155170 RepID=UPI00343EC5F8